MTARTKILHHVSFLIIIPFIILMQGCKSSSLSTAEEYFKKGEYFKAEKVYRELYRKTTGKENRDYKAFLAKRIGESNLSINRYLQAENAFRNALRYGSDSTEILPLLFESYLGGGKIKDAEALVSTIEKLGASDYTSPLALWNNGAMSRYKISPVEVLNGRRSNYSPAFHGSNHDVIFYTSTEEYSKGTERSGITGTKFSDIWTSRKDESGKWLRSRPLGEPINTDDDEGTPTFSPDGLTMYFSRSVKARDKETHVTIWKSEQRNGEWQEPMQVEFPGYENFNFAHPAVSYNGQYLYFASDRPGGYGGYDIWRIATDDSEHNVENLGPSINGAENELFPYSRNDSTFYFSSNSHKGYGGLDIFVARRNHDYSWNVINMGLPINSAADDFGIIFDADEKGYLSSNRGDPRGYDHLFFFELPLTDCRLEGYIMDTDEYAIPDADIRLIGNDGTTIREKSKTDGSFSFPLNPGTKYAVQAAAKDYLNISTRFETENDDNDRVYNVSFTLVPVNRPVTIDNIYYDFDKATLREESKTALDSLIAMLENYPNITIAINSHTDRKGSEEYNMDLSKRRASSVTEYLINKGKIDSKRLMAVGKGKTQPAMITPKLSNQFPSFTEGKYLTADYIETLEEEEREIADQINRRTEFIITSTDYYLY